MYRTSKPFQGQNITKIKTLSDIHRDTPPKPYSENISMQRDKHIEAFMTGDINYLLRR